MTWGRQVVALAAIALTVAPPALAQPYRWIDERGNVHYGDRPPQNPPPTLENMNPAARHRSAETAVERRPPTASPEPGAPAAGRTGAPRLSVAPLPAPRPPGPATPAPREAPPVSAPAAGPSSPPRSVPSDAPSVSGADSSVTDVDGIAPEIMARAGMDRWLDHLVALSRTEFGRLRRRLAEPEAVWTALAQGFRREEMAAPAAGCLLRGLGSDERSALLTWFRSPLAERQRRLLDEATSPQRQFDYRDFVSLLPDSPPPAARLALVQAWERETRTTAMQIDVERRARRAIADVLRPLLARGEPAATDADDERDDAEQERLRFFIVTMMLFAYRGLSDGDLDAMTRFAGSPTGARFTQVFQECVRVALTAAERRAGLAIRPLATARGGQR